MGKFRQDNQDGLGRRNDSGKRRFGGSRDSGFRRGRESGRGFSRRDSNRRPLEMHEAVCDKCGKKCEVPFKPTGGKPVYCRECFKKNDSSKLGFRNRESRVRDFKCFQSGARGMSPEQFRQINEKLDKILAFLGNLVIEDNSDDDSKNASEDDSKEETKAE